MDNFGPGVARGGLFDKIIIKLLASILYLSLLYGLAVNPITEV